LSQDFHVLGRKSGSKHSRKFVQDDAAAAIRDLVLFVQANPSQKCLTNSRLQLFPAHQFLNGIGVRPDTLPALNEPMLGFPKEYER
jgi:hypothetical protein